MPRNKIKFALRISPEMQELVKELCPRDNCQTQNEFIERASGFMPATSPARRRWNICRPLWSPPSALP